MRIIISIFALSMFLSCQEETSSGFRQCGRMIISDALPVQFWLSECDTFNEHEAGGVHHVCWCQPWNCDDEIAIQFQADASVDYTLLVINKDEDVIYTQAIPEVQTGVYQTSLIPSDQSICDETVRLLIVPSSNITELIQDPTFDTGTGWSNVGSGDAWTVTSGRAEVTGLTASSVSRFFSDSFSDTTGLLTLNFSAQLRYASGVNSKQATMLIAFLKDGEEVSRITENFAITDVLPAHVITKTYSISGSVDQVLFNVSGVTGGGTWDFWVTDFSLIEYNYDSSAKSDCLEISEAHDETIFIEYSNDKNYAGLVYENDSPDTTFGIRVPCRFFHEVEPEEDEAMELTSSVIITSSQVKTQRLLEVKHGPYYWHKKLRRVLKHQNVTIFDKQWKKEEKYEVIEGKKTWPLKAATCLLTEKSSVVRNVL